MTNGDLYVQAVESIYASGIEADRISDALIATSRLLGARGGTLEVIDKATGKLLQFHSAGLPSAGGAEYSKHFAALNPRIPPILHQSPGEVCFDYKVMDEAAMKRDPFYSEFLPAMSLRYFISAVLEQTPDRMAVISFQRTRRKGHADRSDIYQLARSLGELSKKARDGKLKAVEMQGGSFTISSLGGIGGTAFTPIINAPEVAILGVAKSSLKPVYDRGGFIPRLMLPLCLSYDHRVIDGAEAARFIVFLSKTLSDVKGLL